MQTEHKIAMCRLVGVMLVTDGQLTDEEYDYFYGLMDRLDLDDESRSKVTGAISIGTDLTPDVATLREAGHGDALVETLREAATIDGKQAPIELDVLRRVEAMLG